MTFVIILILAIITWMIFGRKISLWFRAMMMRRMEDALRRGMGMPTRKEEEKARRKAEKGRRQQHRPDSGGRRAAGAYDSDSRDYDPSGPIIPPGYAEDVEYTEYKEYSEAVEIRAEDGHDGNTDVIVESQVSDVEYVEIKS